jgi:hypothetical protein
MHGNITRIDLEALFAVDPPTLPDTTLPDVPQRPTPPRRGIRRLAVTPPQRQTISLDAVPAYIAEHVAAYLAEPNPKEMLLLALPAGAGKTTAMVRVAEEYAKTGRVMFCAPRHNFILDIREIAKQPAWWLEWQPRRAADDEAGKPATCRYPDQINTWMKQGHRALDFCTQYNVCGWKYLKTQCAYHAQARRPEPIIFAQHAHAALSHPLMSQVSLLIGDELPLSAFPREIFIPKARLSLNDPDAPAALHDLLDTLQSLCRRDMEPLSGMALIDALGGAEAIIDAFTGFETPTPTPPTLLSADDVYVNPYAFIDPLQEALSREAIAAGSGMTTWIERVMVRAGGVEVLARYTADHLPSHVIWCDATGRAGMYEHIFGRPVRLVEPSIAPKGKVYQVYAALHTKTSLTRRSDADSEAAISVERNIRDVREQISQIASNYRNVGVISYKDVVADIAPDGALIDYFYGNRGSNRMQHCDALFVVGTPMPSPYAVQRMAAMIYHERMEPFDTTWSERETLYEAAAATDVSGYWHDPALHDLLEVYRCDELIQSLNRSRLVRNDTHVYLLTRFPLPLPVTLMTLPEVFGAVKADGTPITAIPARRFAQVQRAVEALLTEYGAITIPQFAEAINVSNGTATRYAHALVETGRYLLATQPSTGGRPPLTLRKRP